MLVRCPRSANRSWTGWPAPAADSRSTPWSSSTSPRPPRGSGTREPAVSWTGFVIATVARAVAAAPRGERPQGRQPDALLRPRRHRRDRGTARERHAVLDIVMIRDADQKSCPEITRGPAPRQVRSGARQHPQSGLTAALVRLPGPLRRSAIRLGGDAGRASRRRSGPPWGSPRSGCSPTAGVGPSRSRR